MYSNLLKHDILDEWNVETVQAKCKIFYNILVFAMSSKMLMGQASYAWINSSPYYRQTG